MTAEQQENAQTITEWASLFVYGALLIFRKSGRIDVTGRRSNQLSYSATLFHVGLRVLTKEPYPKKYPFKVHDGAARSMTWLLSRVRHRHPNPFLQGSENSYAIGL